MRILRSSTTSARSSGQVAGSKEYSTANKTVIVKCANAAPAKAQHGNEQRTAYSIEGLEECRKGHGGGDIQFLTEAVTVDLYRLEGKGQDLGDLL